MAIVFPKRAEILRKSRVTARPPRGDRRTSCASKVNFSPNNNGCIVARLWRLEPSSGKRGPLLREGLCRIGATNHRPIIDKYTCLAILVMAFSPY